MFITFIELIKPAFYHAVVKQAFLVRPAAEVLFKHFVGGNDIKLPARDFLQASHFLSVFPLPLSSILSRRKISYNGTPFPGRGGNLMTSPVLYFI